MSSLEYKIENSYPDLLDLERMLVGMQADSKTEKNYSSSHLFQDFAATFDWFHRILPLLHFKGTHSFTSVIDVKAVVEDFIGRDIQEDAFIAACHERGLSIRNMGCRGYRFHDLEIKIPPTHHAADLKPQWEEYVSSRLKI